MKDTPIFFTLCSNNYLAQAKTLGDSILRFYPDSRLIVGLIDYRDPEIDYLFFENIDILGFNEIEVPDFKDMLTRYNVIEFNTSVKPFYIDYLWKKSKGDKPIVVYLDPDIFLYQALDHVFESLRNNSIVLTPMFCEASEQTSLDELVALRHGMFNLGFIALKYSKESQRFINWWKERLRTHCLIDKPNGIFVDQKWVDLAPLLFEEIYILKNKGYNMAWWNFSERMLIDNRNEFAVNFPDQLLYFFHFSGFKIDSNYITGRSGEPQFSYSSRPELKRLGLEYRSLLVENKYEFFSALTPKLNFFEPQLSKRGILKRKIKRFLNKF